MIVFSMNPLKITKVKLGDVTSLPKTVFTKNLSNSNEIFKNNEYKYEMSMIGRKLETQEEEENLLNQYLTVDKENKHYISTAIFQEENTKKFHEKDTPISILIRNPLGIIIFFIVVYILYPRLWKKEYFSKRTLERNNLTIFKTYNSIYYTRYNYINYRRGLYACVRSNFS